MTYVYIIGPIAIWVMGMYGVIKTFYMIGKYFFKKVRPTRWAIIEVVILDIVFVLFIFGISYVPMGISPQMRGKIDSSEGKK